MKRKILPFILILLLLSNVSSVCVFAEGNVDTPEATRGENFCESTYLGMYDSSLSTFISVCRTMKYNGGEDGSTWIDIISCCDILSTGAGNVQAGYGVLYRYMRESLRTPSDCLSYMQSKFTSNGEGGYNIPQSTQDELKVENREQVQFQYRYLPRINYLNPTRFGDARVYYSIINLVNANPEYLFWISQSTNVICCTKLKYLGGLIPDNQMYQDMYNNTTMYNEYWNQNFNNPDGEYLSFAIENGLSDGKLTFTYVEETVYDQNLNRYDAQWSDPVEYNSATSFGNINLDRYLDPEVNQVYTENGGQTNVFSRTLTYRSVQVMDSFYNSNYINEGVFSAANLQVPCFFTLNDLKKGTVGKNAGEILPTFRGVNSINGVVSASQLQQAEQIINNYYNSSNNNNPGGGGNNNNNNSDDPSSGSFWDKLGSLVSGLLGFIVDVLNSALEALTNVFDSIKGFFSGAVDLVGSGFADLMGAFFPYIPPEWITIVGLVLGLSVFFFILKHFL